MIKEIKNELLGESYFKIEHSSGLTVYVMKKEGYKSSYAIFGTAFGSADNHYITAENDEITLPDGTAHFLEHKLFESEEKDAFERFSQTGAMANAYTSFDRTCYLFQCSSNFYTNLEILLDFVQSPYFTEQTVAKEQGIIGQEIKMYEDSPEWQATMGVLAALYENCAVNKDIAGDVESIAKITPETLYSAYNGFYNLNNMVLSVVGDVDPAKVLGVCDRTLKTENSKAARSVVSTEPLASFKKKSVKKMQVGLPIFAFGYKEPHTGIKTLKEKILTIILNQVLIGNMSPLYQSLIEEGLINDEFESEYFTSRNYSAVLFTGTSKDPEAVKVKFEQEVNRVRENGIDKELFDCIVKELYGDYIVFFNSVERLANALCECEFSSYGLFDEMEIYKAVTVDDAQELLKEKYNPEASSISIIIGE